MTSINDILQKAPQKPGPSYFTARGLLSQSDNEDTFLIYPDAPDCSAWAEVRRSDIVGQVQEVPESGQTLQETGLKLHRVRIQHGARVRYNIAVGTRVGDTPPPAEDFDVSTNGTGRSVSLSDAMEHSEGGACDDSRAVSGVILPWNEPGVFMLQFDPGSRREFGLFHIDDVLNADDIPTRADCDPDGPAERIVRLRKGAAARIVRSRMMLISHRTKQRFPSDQVETDKKSGCSCDESISDDPDNVTQQLAAAGSCKTRVGKCGSGIKGSGYPCKNPGTTCDWGWWTGTCTTEESYWWTCVCDCDLGGDEEEGSEGSKETSAKHYDRS